MPTVGWKGGEPSRLLFPTSAPWIGHVILGILTVAFSGVVVVAAPFHVAGMRSLWVIAGLIAVTSIYWLLFILPEVARPLFGVVGISLRHKIHGEDDRGDFERGCDICSTPQGLEKHRHAQDGYIVFQSFTLASERYFARALMRLLGGTWEVKNNMRDNGVSFEMSNHQAQPVSN